MPKVTIEQLEARLEEWHEKRYGGVSCPRTYRKLLEEVGELGEALMVGDTTSCLHECGDVLAVLSHLVRSLGRADLTGIKSLRDVLEYAVEKVEEREKVAADRT